MSHRYEVAHGNESEVPLLGNDTHTLQDPPTASRGLHGLNSATPIPWKQAGVVAFAGFSEPILVNFTFPFINEMLEGWSNSAEQIAFRSGIFYGGYCLAQFCSVYFWGTISDRIGRKPVILACLLVGLISTAFLGVSGSFAQALVLRIITGSGYGDVPVLRSAMGDITDNTNQAFAFSFLPLTWALGNTFAPLIGGLLIHPVDRFPRMFQDNLFFKEHPYALACFTASSISVLAFTAIFFLFKESLPKSEYRWSHNVATAAENSPSAILGNRIVRTVLLSYFGIAFAGSSHDVIFPLWMFLQPQDGGVGLKPAQIAFVLSLSSLLQTLNVLIVFPRLQRRIGTTAVLQFAVGMNLAFIPCYPVVAWIAQLTRSGSLTSIGGGNPVWVDVHPVLIAAIVMMLVVRSFANLTWAAIMLLVTNAAPTPDSLGAVNSVAQMAATAARAIGPPIFASIYTISLDGSIVGKKGAIWTAMLCAGLVSLFISRRVREGQHEWRIQREELRRIGE
ncbi:MFS general substrate transporter [Clavulina sp. PMI_390]|nr:MFS general substrate transporter [Clavulina sp. PMI_390]